MHKHISKLYSDLTVFPFPHFKTHSRPTSNPNQLLNIVNSISSAMAVFEIVMYVQNVVELI
jgi:hypothetical protein